MKIFNLLTACALAAPLLFVSCSDDAVTTPDAGDGVSVSLKLGVSAGPGAISRADGDNYDIGLDGERKVNDALLVIYDRPINYAGDDGKVVKTLYFPGTTKFTPSSVTTDPSYFDPVPSFYPQTDVLNQIIVGRTNISDAWSMECKIDDKELEIGKRYYAIALCNFGDDMPSTFYEGMPLKDFRDYVYAGALYDTAADIKGYTNFRMTGINECSFIWERRTDGSSFDLGQYLVQRLAARVDVALGEASVDYLNPGSSDDYIRLAVYTQKEGSTEYEIVKENGSVKYNFYLTDLKIVNPVNTGTYLVERSSVHSPSWLDENNKAAVPIYLDNEGWAGSFVDKDGGQGDRKATKYIFAPKNKGYGDIYSLVAKAGYPDVAALASAGSFYFTSNVSTAKQNSSLVGYLPENTCSDTHYTMLRIEGYTNASTSAIFTGSRAVPNQDNLTHVVGDIPIMHNLAADSHVMDYAVVRNTIYRLRIKVIANDNKIYFRYYFVLPDGSTSQKPYDVTAFKKEVNDNKQDYPDIND